MFNGNMVHTIYIIAGQAFNSKSVAMVNVFNKT